MALQWNTPASKRSKIHPQGSRVPSLLATSLASHRHLSEQVVTIYR
ncbi:MULTISPECIES: hypothetical protein [unclassified Alteromonas]|nr:MULTISPECIES: hypothetical protein [unclassified Alteromonas]MBO7922740.1 hypothetical protein [Alteromonas sp. K632G]